MATSFLGKAGLVKPVYSNSLPWWCPASKCIILYVVTAVVVSSKCIIHTWSRWKRRLFYFAAVVVSSTCLKRGQRCLFYFTSVVLFQQVKCILLGYYTVVLQPSSLRTPTVMLVTTTAAIDGALVMTDDDGDDALVMTESDLMTLW